MSAEIGHTGLAIVDSLQGVQMMANNINAAERKLEYVRNSVAIIGALSLKGTKLFVSAAEWWVEQPDPTYSYFKYPFTLRAEVTALTYLYDLEVPVDSLSLKVNPIEVLYVNLDDEAAFLDSIINVPVLSIITAQAA